MKYLILLLGLLLLLISYIWERSTSLEAALFGWVLYLFLAFIWIIIWLIIFFVFNLQLHL